EYVDGQSLAEVLEKRDRLPVTETLKIARQIVLALKTAHAHGVIHRDLKPGNILIDERGVVKLTDFGMAYLGEEPSITQQNSIIGTPAYMAPEQVTGEAITPATDFFALGATLYEMLTGVKPFGGDNYSACLQKILNETPSPPSQLCSDIDIKIDAFVLHLLEKEEKKRLHSADNVLYQLDRLSSGQQKATAPELAQIAKEEKALAAKEHVSKSEPARVDVKKTVPWNRRFVISAVIFIIVLAVAAIGFRSLISEKPGNAESDLLLKKGSLGTGQDEQTIQKSEPKVAANLKHEAQNQKSNLSSDEAKRKPINQIIPSLQSAAELDSTLNQEIEKKPVSMDTLATLHIHVKPWAAVTINGRVVDSMTVNWQKQMPPGHYNVVLAHPEFSPKIFSIELQQGQPDTIFYSFLRQAAYLSVSVRPWADIYIDGKYIDSTPLKRPIAMDGGTHEIELRNPYYQTYRQLVLATPGDTLVIQKRLQK
ncbi:MAG: protein kinase, partial [Calditrichaeota bacterium]|nr:protein kinase [Calditrichota bacterium]